MLSTVSITVDFISSSSLVGAIDFSFGVVTLSSFRLSFGRFRLRHHLRRLAESAFRADPIDHFLLWRVAGSSKPGMFFVVIAVLLLPVLTSHCFGFSLLDDRGFPG